MEENYLAHSIDSNAGKKENTTNPQNKTNPN